MVDFKNLNGVLNINNFSNDGWANLVFESGSNEKLLLLNSLNKNIRIIVKEDANIELTFFVDEEISSNKIEFYLEVQGNLKLHQLYLSSINNNDVLLTSKVYSNGNFINTLIDLNKGNSLIKLESNIVEEGGITSSYTATIAGEKQVKNLIINNVNYAPHTEAYMTNFGIGYDQGKLVVDGIGDIRNGAHGSVNKQKSTMVVFDELAKATNKPLLLIDEDDVIANHASAVGKIDEQTIFYLCSRGLSLKQAKKFISFGYFKPVIALISDELMKEKVLDYLEEVIKDD